MFRGGAKKRTEQREEGDFLQHRICAFNPQTIHARRAGKSHTFSHCSYEELKALRSNQSTKIIVLDRP